MRKLESKKKQKKNAHLALTGIIKGTLKKRPAKNDFESITNYHWFRRISI